MRLFLPFDDFARPVAVPASVAEYGTYMVASIDFVSARNERIASNQAQPDSGWAPG